MISEAAPGSSEFSRGPPWPVLLTALVVTGLVMVLLSRSYTTDESRACAALYNAARTRADTTVVDATLPPRCARPLVEQRTCGSLRVSARWVAVKGR